MVVHDLDGLVVFAIRDVAGADVGAEHLALPPGRTIETQLGHTQTERIALRADVIDLADAVVGGQAVHPGADQTQVDPALGVRQQSIQRRRVGDLRVHAVGLILGQVHEGGHGADQGAVRFPFNLAAQRRIAAEAAVDQILRRDGGDHVVDLDAVIVQRHVQAGNRRGRVGHAQRQRIGRFRQQVGIAAAVVQNVDALLLQRIVDRVVAGRRLRIELRQVG
ncbi:hypothetical protein D3C86_1118980 [compost metagenome]